MLTGVTNLNTQNDNHLPISGTKISQKIKETFKTIPEEKTGGSSLINREVDHDKSSDITNTNNPDSTRSNKEDNKKYLEEKYEQIVGFESEVEELGKIIENYRESKIAKEANRIEKRIKGAIETEKQKIGETTKSVKEKIEFVKKQQKEIKNLKVEECIKDMQNLEISNAKIEEFLRKKYSAAKDYEITKRKIENTEKEKIGNYIQEIKNLKEDIKKTENSTEKVKNPKSLLLNDLDNIEVTVRGYLENIKILEYYRDIVDLKGTKNLGKTNEKYKKKGNIKLGFIIESFEIENNEKNEIDFENIEKIDNKLEIGDKKDTRDEIYEEIKDDVIKFKEDEVNIIGLEKEINTLGKGIEALETKISEIGNENFKKTTKEFENKYLKEEIENFIEETKDAIKKIKNKDPVKTDIETEKRNEELKERIEKLEEEKRKIELKSIKVADFLHEINGFFCDYSY